MQMQTTCRRAAAQEVLRCQPCHFCLLFARHQQYNQLIVTTKQPISTANMAPSTSISAPPSSWLDIAPTSDFSLANLPFGICSFPTLHQPRPRCCTILGDHVIDLSLLAEAGLFDGIDGLSSPTSVFSKSTLNAFMALSRSVWKAVRMRLFSLLASSADGDDTNENNNCNLALSSNPALRAAAIHLVSETKMHLPAEIGDYTDFYSSREHATNGAQTCHIYLCICNQLLS